MTKQVCIMVVEDDALIRLALSQFLETMGYRVCATASNGPAAVDLALEHRPRLILMDVRLKGAMDGIDAALAINDHFDCKTVFITGSTETETLDRINQDHPDAVLIKPILPAQLAGVIDRLLS